MASERLIARIMMHEGFRSKPYKCTAGKLTIGYGRNLDDTGVTITEGKTLLWNDVQRAENDLHLLLSQHGLVAPQSLWLLAAGQARHEVLIEMVFNLGVTRLRKFRKMWAALAASDFKLAADEMLDSKWAEQVGERADTLADIMEFGEDAWELILQEALR